MLSALADEHVKFAIARGLRLRGMEVVTAQEQGLTKLGRLLLTNDKGFLRVDARWAAAGKPHAGIVFWPQSGRSIGDAIRRLIAYAASTLPEEAANRVKFL